MHAPKHVAVIGGGCAGLAAAATLAQHGVAVALFEASPTLGGRARGVQYKKERLDNGQHILLGAYSETLGLLKLANVSESTAFLRLPLQLVMLKPESYETNHFELRAVTCLPAPLHILAGLLKAKGLSLTERMAAIRFMIWMKLAGFKLAKDEPLHSLLARKAQPERLTSLLWEPLCLAALNTPIQTASAQVFLNVLRDSFSKSKSDSDMLLPRSDLSALMAEPLATYIKQNGGIVRSNTTAIKVNQDAEHGSFLVETETGQAHFSHIIMAVSPFRLSGLIGHLPGLSDILRPVEAFNYQPIYTIYLQYPASVKLDSPMVGLESPGFDLSGSGNADNPGFSQWVFDRGALYGQHGLLAVVISAEGAHQELKQEELARAVAAELSAYFPQLPEPLWHKVIAEKRATFACTASLARPSQATPLHGLYLSGDYTAGDYPATIEGAVRSGVQCANRVISGTGH